MISNFKPVYIENYVFAETNFLYVEACWPKWRSSLQALFISTVFG